jgi:hypothetical protein
MKTNESAPRVAWPGFHAGRCNEYVRRSGTASTAMIVTATFDETGAWHERLGSCTIRIFFYPAPA